MVIDLSQYDPPWAHNCGKCQHGLINPPPARAYAALYVIRAIQYDKGYLVLCDCEAGQRYERLLQKRLAEICRRRDLVSGRVWAQVIADAEQDTAMPDTLVLTKEGFATVTS